MTPLLKESKRNSSNKVTLLRESIPAATATAKSLQSCPTFSDPMDYSLPGSSIHGILQVRVPEWGAIAVSASIPRQVDKKSEVPKEEKGVWGS